MSDVCRERPVLSVLPHALLHGWGQDGEPMPNDLRRRMEALFGASFDSVTIRTGPGPEGFGAAAFAWGERLHFAPGVFDPASGRGEEVLIHELAHVIQQREGRASAPIYNGGGVVLLDDPALEAEAAAIAAGQRPRGSTAIPLRPGAGVVQCITYRDLREVGSSYSKEEGTASKHRTASNHSGGETELKLLVLDYNQKIAEVSITKSGLGWLTRTSKIDALKREIEPLRRKIEERRKFFELQGFKLNADGSIDWSASQTVVAYDHGLARQGMTKLVGRGGKLYWESTGTPASTENLVTFFSKLGFAIYVMSSSGSLHMHSHSIGQYHHSSLLKGGKVAGAGEMKISADGTLTYLSNKSGHYTPSAIHLAQVIHQLGKMGIPPSYTVEHRVDKYITHTMSVTAFMQNTDSEHDYELIRLLDYSLSFNDPRIRSLLNMEWRSAPAHGFYLVTTSQKVDHRVARKSLKSIGIQPNTVHLGASSQLCSVPSSAPNVLPGPMNNAATGNGYGRSPSGPKPATPPSAAPTAHAYGNKPPAHGYGNKTADYYQNA